MNANRSLSFLALIVFVTVGCQGTPQTPKPASSIPTTEMPVIVIVDEQVRALAEAGMARNADWTPYTKEINGVLMALVPKGCFQMGSNEDPRSDRDPVHEVCFEEPFWIDVYEVTNEQFGSVGTSSYSTKPDQPRIWLGWNESLAHCESRGARLPTEAEWEYAARGPDGLIYPWGNTFEADNVVYLGNNSGYSSAPVGSKPGGVSWIGAYDLSGNVREFVNDWYDLNYYGSLADRTVNPQGPDTGDTHVSRGGTWIEPLSDLRAINRSESSSDVNPYTGFRCAFSYSP